MRLLRFALVLLCVHRPFAMSASAADAGLNGVAGQFQVLNDNGAWSWFMDDRAQLLVGSVRAKGRFEHWG